MSGAASTGRRQLGRGGGGSSALGTREKQMSCPCKLQPKHNPRDHQVLYTAPDARLNLYTAPNAKEISCVEFPLISWLVHEQ